MIMNKERRKEFIRALESPLAMAAAISHLSRWFTKYESIADDFRKNREQTQRVLSSFKKLAGENQITANLFFKDNGSGITSKDFTILTNPAALDEKEVGGPDDIFPWDKVSMIPSWKFVMLATLLSSLCSDIMPNSILEGHNMSYMIKECRKTCTSKCEIITEE